MTCAISAGVWVQTGQNYCSSGSRFIILWYISLYRAHCCVTDVKPVDKRAFIHRNELALYQPNGHGHDRLYSFAHSVELMLENCNGCRTVYISGLSLSFEGQASHLNAVVLASIVQKLPMLHTAMGTWALLLVFWVAECSVFRRVLLQLILQWWLHMCSATMLNTFWEPEVMLLCWITPYFSRTMPSHKWWGLCKPSLNNNRYHYFFGLHVHQTYRPQTCLGYGW